MFMLPLFALSQEIAEPTAFLSPCFHFQKSLHFEGLQFPSRPLGLKWYFRPRGEEVFDWIISSDLLPPNNFDMSTLLHRASGSRSSPDFSFVSSFLALICSWEMLQDLGFDHLPILLTVSFYGFSFNPLTKIS